MDFLLTKHIKNLKELDKQRKAWLALSIFVVISIIAIIFEWQDLKDWHYIWIIASLGLIISAIWWYWTMRLAQFLIQYRMEESRILRDIVVDIKEIKTSIIIAKKQKKN